jgi:hypothetical protein
MANYVTGHNMAGYLPESDPWITADWESARDSLLWDLESVADYFAEGLEDDRGQAGLAAADEAIAEVKALKHGETFLAHVDISVYWLETTDEMPEDED